MLLMNNNQACDGRHVCSWAATNGVYGKIVLFHLVLFAPIIFVLYNLNCGSDSVARESLSTNAIVSWIHNFIAAEHLLE